MPATKRSAFVPTVWRSDDGFGRSGRRDLRRRSRCLRCFLRAATGPVAVHRESCRAKGGPVELHLERQDRGVRCGKVSEGLGLCPPRCVCRGPLRVTGRRAKQGWRSGLGYQPPAPPSAFVVPPSGGRVSRRRKRRRRSRPRVLHSLAVSRGTSTELVNPAPVQQARSVPLSPSLSSTAGLAPGMRSPPPSWARSLELHAMETTDLGIPWKAVLGRENVGDWLGFRTASVWWIGQRTGRSSREPGVD